MPSRVPSYRPPGRDDPERRKRQYERAPQRQEDKDFYKSKPWLGLRLLKLTLNPTCERCRKDKRYVAATHVHHVRERKDHPSLSLDIDNLESLCASCHSSHHARGKMS